MQQPREKERIAAVVLYCNAMRRRRRRRRKRVCEAATRRDGAASSWLLRPSQSEQRGERERKRQAVFRLFLDRG